MGETAEEGDVALHLHVKRGGAVARAECGN